MPYQAFMPSPPAPVYFNLGLRDAAETYQKNALENRKLKALAESNALTQQSAQEKLKREQEKFEEEKRKSGLAESEKVREWQAGIIAQSPYDQVDTPDKLGMKVGGVDKIHPDISNLFNQNPQQAYQAIKTKYGKPQEPISLEEQYTDLSRREETKAKFSKPSTIPQSISEFELTQYGKEVPELRGTKEYLDRRLKFLKEKRDATTAPSKTEPKILRQEFINQSKNFVAVRDSYNRIKSSAKEPSAAGDLAMIFNYMKMLDPGSVVRESEFATAAATGAYGERIKAQVARVISGQRLSDVMRKDFVNRSDMLYAEQERSHRKLTGEYDRLAKELGVEPSNVIIDYITKQQESSTSGLPPEIISKLKEGEATTFQNGQIWTLKDGQPIRIK